MTIQLVQNLLLTSRQKFRFGLVRAGQAKVEPMFWSKPEVLHKLNGHPVNLLGLSEQKFVSDLPLQIPK